MIRIVASRKFSGVEKEEQNLPTVRKSSSVVKSMTGSWNVVRGDSGRKRKGEKEGGKYVEEKSSESRKKKGASSHLWDSLTGCIKL